MRLLTVYPAVCFLTVWLLRVFDGLVSASLTDLNIAGNEIGVEGAKAIAAALPR